MDRDVIRLTVIFVMWVMRRLKEKGFVNGGFITTDAGEAEYWEDIERLRHHVGEKTFCMMVKKVTGQSDEFCSTIAKMARKLNYIADSDDNLKIDD